MREFHFRAVTRDDVPEEGVVMAEDSVAAGRRLVAQGLYPLTIAPSRSVKGILNSEISRGGLSSTDIVQLLNDLGHLISAGVEVAQTLSLVSKSSSPRIQVIVRRILMRVRNGHSLGEAMCVEGKLFSDHIIAVVKAGEASNNLGSSLLVLSDSLAKSAALRSQVLTAMIYPACISVALVVAVVVLVAIVVPTLDGLFAGRESQLPWQTMILVKFGAAVRNNIALVIGALASLAVISLVLFKIPPVRLRVERLALSIPGVGEFLRAIETARISEMLATLTTSAIPLIDAVAMARNGSQLLVTRSALDDVIVALRRGLSLREAIANVPTLTGRVLAIIQIGESTARLGPLLEEASRDARRAVSVQTDRVLALVPPAMTLIFGAIAGAVLYAVMTAILSVNTLVGQGV